MQFHSEIEGLTVIFKGLIIQYKRFTYAYSAILIMRQAGLAGFVTSSNVTIVSIAFTSGSVNHEDLFHFPIVDVI